MLFVKFIQQFSDANLGHTIDSVFSCFLSPSFINITFWCISVNILLRIVLHFVIKWYSSKDKEKGKL